MLLDLKSWLVPGCVVLMCCHFCYWGLCWLGHWCAYGWDAERGKLVWVFLRTFPAQLVGHVHQSVGGVRKIRHFPIPFFQPLTSHKSIKSQSLIEPRWLIIPELEMEPHLCPSKCSWDWVVALWVSLFDVVVLVVPGHHAPAVACFCWVIVFQAAIFIYLGYRLLWRRELHGIPWVVFLNCLESCCTLGKTNISPEHWWLKDKPFLSKRSLFGGHSFIFGCAFLFSVLSSKKRWNKDSKAIRRYIHRVQASRFKPHSHTWPDLPTFGNGCNGYDLLLIYILYIFLCVGIFVRWTLQTQVWACWAQWRPRPWSTQGPSGMWGNPAIWTSCCPGHSPRCQSWWHSSWLRACPHVLSISWCDSNNTIIFFRADGRDERLGGRRYDGSCPYKVFRNGQLCKALWQQLFALLLWSCRL